MSEFVLHPDALKDLEEIWEYIAADNPDSADRVREEIYDAIKSLLLRAGAFCRNPERSLRRNYPSLLADRRI